MAIPADAAAEPDYLALPDAPAVCIFESPERRTLLLATTASARDLARRRLAPLPTDERTSRADLRAICGHVHAIRVGSPLEADAVYLHQARTRLPELARVVAERWRAWFVHVDPDAEFPQWTKTNLMVGLVGKRSASSLIGGGKLPAGVFLGPLPDKDAAGRFIEAMIDCFDLCRFHNLLVQAPKAAACAYKEMGRCPAPCDGTETMKGYRSRTREAAGMIGSGMLVPTVQEETRACVAMVEAGDEQAGMERGKRAKQLSALRKPAFAHVAFLNECALLLLLPSATPKRVRFVLAHRGRLESVAEVDPSVPEEIAAAATATRLAHRHAAPLAIGPPPSHPTETVDTIAITTRWLFTAEKKRRGERVRLDVPAASPDPLDAKTLQRVAKSVLIRTKPGELHVETQEIEGGG